MNRTRTTDEIRCPECDEPIGGNLGRVPAAVSSAGGVVLATDCPACSSALEVRAGDDRPSVRRVDPAQ